MKTFTANDLFLGRYKTKFNNWIFVFRNKKNHNYEILVQKEYLNIFLEEYKLKENIFYINDK